MGSLGSVVGNQGSHVVLFYVNVSGMHPQSSLSSQPLTILAPQVLLCIRWSIPLVPLFHTWVTASRFLAGNREAELKPTTFSSLLLFPDFLSFFFSLPNGPG